MRGPFGDGDFRSATVPGDTVLVEYDPAEDRGGLEVIPFAIREVSHHGEDPVAQSSVGDGSPKAAWCNPDYKCYPPWANAGQSVAHIR